MNASLVTSAVKTRSRSRVAALAVPATLYLVALALRASVVWLVPFTLNEGSAYYLAVARNISAGRGPVIDAIWSYATPPLTLPRDAFELWQPLASYLAAAPMRLLGPSLSTAQIGFALFGALIAPLAWWIAADAANRLELPHDRQRAVAIGSGLLAAVTAPFVLAAAVPDSTLPFTVLAVAACAAMPAASRGGARAIAVLGLLLGFAYLTRMEAIYLGLVFVFFAWSAGSRGRQLLVRVGAVAVIGAMVALPWWLRDLATFGTPLPSQIAQNLFMTGNDQIFAFTNQPTLAGFLAQGVPTILANIASAAWHDLVEVLLLPAVIVVVVGGVAAIVGRRHRLELRASALAALLLYGTVAFALTTVLFPVATVWGTFAHAAGPLLVALTILAALGGDAFVTRVRQWRHWSRANLWLAPAALVALSVPLTLFQVVATGQQAANRQQQLNAAAAVARTSLSLDPTRPVISDHPVWLSDALDVPAIALPDESAQSVLELATTFSADAIVVIDAPERAAALTAAAPGCFVPIAASQTSAVPGLAVLTIEKDCL